MSTLLVETDKIDQTTKDIVYGYIRRIKKVLPYEQDLYSITETCLIYYYNHENNLYLDSYLNIGTYNVHNWEDANCDSNIFQIINCLKTINIDILALCEVDTRARLKFNENISEWEYIDAVEYLKKEIDFNDIYESQTINEFPYRNDVCLAIKTDYKITETINSAQFNIITLPSNMNNINLGIFTVHFDYEWESIRLTEFEEIAKVIKKYNNNLCLVIMGDFNALKRRDYDDKRWKEICNVRWKNKWELPQTKLIDIIENKYGFYDCLYLKKNDDNNGEYNRFDNITNDNMDTCRYKTRIDYVYINKKMLETFDVIKYHHFDFDNASDHKFVKVTFKFKSK